MSEVIIYTDGGCSGNPGPGGYAFILRLPAGGEEVLGSGGEANTTNNRMELRAVIASLEEAERRLAGAPGASVVVNTDSQFVKNGVGSWMANWKRNGWRTADKKPVKNVDLWQRLEAALGPHQVRWHWVRGHSGHDLNERADVLAREAIAEMRKTGGAGG
jgi:ribonuclease HI